MYPICDNDSPKLSADRLEYSLSNIVNFRVNSQERIKQYYDNLIVDEVDGDKEIVFTDKNLAVSFAREALKTCKVYCCDEDRYAMQILSEIMKKAFNKGIIDKDDLYTNETSVISKLTSDEELNKDWNRFTNLTQITDEDNEYKRKIYAKKRYINPYIKGMGRVKDIDEKFSDELDEYLEYSFDYYISAK